SRSRRMTSASPAAAFSNSEGRDPGTNSFERYSRAATRRIVSLKPKAQIPQSSRSRVFHPASQVNCPGIKRDEPPRRQHAKEIAPQARFFRFTAYSPSWHLGAPAGYSSSKQKAAKPFFLLSGYATEGGQTQPSLS